MKRESASESYLRRATRGLWGRKRLEVKEELAAHLAIRMQAHRVAGLSETEAEERVLAELGSPQRVSAGMARLYTLPTVLGSSLAMVVVCVAVVGLWPKGLAQTLEGTYYWPSQPCLESLEDGIKSPKNCSLLSGMFWFSQEQLRQILEPQGVKFDRLFADNAYSAFSITFPGEKPVYVTPGAPNASLYQDGQRVLTAPGQLSLWYFVKTVALQNRVTIEGWENPVVRIGRTALRFQPREVPVVKQAFYINYLQAVFMEDLTTDLVVGFNSVDLRRYEDLIGSSRASEEGLRRTSFRVSRGRGTVYGLITLLDPESEIAIQSRAKSDSFSKAFLYQVVRVTEQDELHVQLPRNPLAFVKSFAYGNDLKPGDSILVRLAGGNPNGGWYEVVSPQEITRPPR